MRKVSIWCAFGLAAGLGLAIVHARAQPVAVPPAPVDAIEYMQSRNLLWAGDQLLLLAVPSFFLFTGLGANLRTWCANRVRENRFWTLILFAISYLILSAVIRAPFDFYRDFWSVRTTGGFEDTAGGWALKETVSLITKVVVATVFIWIPYTLSRARSSSSSVPQSWMSSQAVKILCSSERSAFDRIRACVKPSRKNCMKQVSRSCRSPTSSSISGSNTNFSARPIHSESVMGENLGQLLHWGRCNSFAKELLSSEIIGGSNSVVARWLPTGPAISLSIPIPQLTH
jgi:hypothetical protein